MTRLANKIVSVCAFLLNMQPALVPQPNIDTDDDNTEQEVYDYFQSYYDSDYDADAESSDED